MFLESEGEELNKNAIQVYEWEPTCTYERIWGRLHRGMRRRTLAQAIAFFVLVIFAPDEDGAESVVCSQLNSTVASLNHVKIAVGGS